MFESMSFISCCATNRCSAVLLQYFYSLVLFLVHLIDHEDLLMQGKIFLRRMGGGEGDWAKGGGSDRRGEGVSCYLKGQ
jgi:hypothetical protein